MSRAFVDDEKPLCHPCCPGLECFGTAREKKPTTWPAEDGRILSFEEMSNRHLLLTIRLMIRRASFARAYACMRVMEWTLDVDYDDVFHACDQLWKHTWVEHTCYHFKPMLAEARRRKLRNATKEVIEAYGKKQDLRTARIEFAHISECVNARHERDGGQKGHLVAERVLAGANRRERWFNA